HTFDRIRRVAEQIEHREPQQPRLQLNQLDSLRQFEVDLDAARERQLEKRADVRDQLVEIDDFELRPREIGERTIEIHRFLEEARVVEQRLKRFLEDSLPNG